MMIVMQTMKIKAWKLGLIWVLVAGAAGCGGAKKLVEQVLQEPRLSVQGVRVVGLSAQNADLEVTLGVDNPNAIGLTLSRLSYELDLEDQRLIAGNTDRTSSVPAAGQGEVVIPISVSYPDLAAAYARVKGQDEVNYRIKGQVGIATPLGNLNLPYQASGKMKVWRLPQVKDISLKVDSLSLSEARMRLNLQLENPNAFNLEIQRLHYRIALEGRDFAAGDVALPQTVPARESGRIEIPLSLNLGELGLAAVGLLRGKNADYTLEYSAELLGPEGRLKLEATKQGTLKIFR